MNPALREIKSNPTALRSRPAHQMPAIGWWSQFPFMPDYLMGDLVKRDKDRRQLLAAARGEKTASKISPYAVDLISR